MGGKNWEISGVQATQWTKKAISGESSILFDPVYRTHSVLLSNLSANLPNNKCDPKNIYPVIAVFTPERWFIDGSL